MSGRPTGCGDAPARQPSSPKPRTVWFHRDYQRLTGGHVKHAHYFGHVRAFAGFEPVMTFAGPPPAPALRRERDRLWDARSCVAPHWRPVGDDVLFVAGTDWRYVDARCLGELPHPRINLVQHVRHALPGTELHGYLARRAVRICVSEEVADAVRGTGRANGPVIAIPNGTELSPFGRPDRRTNPVTVVAYKRPALARELSDALHARGIAHRTVYDFIDRDAFLALMADSRIAVCLPRPEEGFYLPALEAMAAGCTVVTMDCIGNRGVCRAGDNCLLGRDADTLADAVAEAESMPPERHARMRLRANATVAEHSLATERARFHSILADIDGLWGGAATGHARTMPRTAARPLVDFMIVGAQKCATTALWQFLGEHPDVGMSRPKEVHVFDAASYDPAWTCREVDVRYAKALAHCPGARIRGEATPAYLYLPDIAARLRRYNARFEGRRPVARPGRPGGVRLLHAEGTAPRGEAVLAGPAARTFQAAPRHGPGTRGFRDARARLPQARPVQRPAAQPLPSLSERASASRAHRRPAPPPRRHHAPDPGLPRRVWRCANPRADRVRRPGTPRTTPRSPSAS